jgi:hypothetical protein
MNVGFVEELVLQKVNVIAQVMLLTSVEYVVEIAHLALVVLMKPHVIMKELL